MAYLAQLREFLWVAVQALVVQVKWCGEGKSAVGTGMVREGHT